MVKSEESGAVVAEVAVPAEGENGNKNENNGEGSAGSEVKVKGVGVEGSETKEEVKEAVKEVEPPKKMRSVILTSFGGLKGVKLAERNQPPEPKEGQVTIKVNISGVSFGDLMMRLGVIDSPPQPKTPFILGTELVGTVSAVGANVTSLKEGDLVFALPETGGGWAEWVNVDCTHVWKVSQPQLSLETLACTLGYLVATLLLQRVNLGEGSKILVHSAGGSVGLALKELASSQGIQVIGIASAHKHEKLEGFSHLIPRGTDYVQQIKKLHPEGLDAVFDAQGGDDCARGLSLLAPLGTYVLYGSANIVTGETKSFFSLAKSWWTQVEKVSPMKLYDENKAIGGFHLRHLLKSSPERVAKALDSVWSLMAQDKVKPVQDLTFHFEQVTQAMQRMHERKNVGKVLIVPEVPPPPTAEEAAAATATAEAAAAGKVKSESVDSNNGESEASPPPSAK